MQVNFDIIKLHDNHECAASVPGRLSPLPPLGDLPSPLFRARLDLHRPRHNRHPCLRAQGRRFAGG